jgi:hypothetical protein
MGLVVGSMFYQTSVESFQLRVSVIFYGLIILAFVRLCALRSRYCGWSRHNPSVSLLLLCAMGSGWNGRGRRGITSALAVSSSDGATADVDVWHPL